MFKASNLYVILSPALEEQLEISHYEALVARLQEFIMVEDHERAVVVGI